MSSDSKPREYVPKEASSSKDEIAIALSLRGKGIWSVGACHGVEHSLCPYVRENDGQECPSSVAAEGIEAGLILI